MSREPRRQILVYADWQGAQGPTLLGTLYATRSRGKELFSFEYDAAWLKSGRALKLDPGLHHFRGEQHAPIDRENFGLFLDSSPDRWGRLLMRRRAAHLARQANRPAPTLMASDYLLGVHDASRFGALRFRTSPNGPFLDDAAHNAAPPMTSLRSLEQASLRFEEEDAVDDPEYGHWLSLLVAPGSSLGGARPKASVVDPKGHLWIAKFPSKDDAVDVGAWESVIHSLAKNAGLTVPDSDVRKIASKHHTFLTKRFDRTPDQRRLHFSSAMTKLERLDGDDAEAGASYLELAEILIQEGARPNEDLEQLWRRILFNVAVSNTDDHLRNHAFGLTQHGWTLSPAYDLNPVPTGVGLSLNISDADNALDIDLVRSVATWFRVSNKRAKEIEDEVLRAVRDWRQEASARHLSRSACDEMAPAFRLVS